MRSNWGSGHPAVCVLPGYGKWNVCTVCFETGETRLCSLVNKDRSYKAMPKANGAQRESDGVVVVMTDSQHNEPIAKGPDFDHAGNVGKRKGMSGNARTNKPVGNNAKVRKLQNRLWTSAKQSPDRRFHALYDRVFRPDVLEEAWKRVSANKGSAGVDKQTLADIEAYGVDRFLSEIHQSLKAGNYHPSPTRRVEIPKPDGKKRPLGIPTVKDRVVQTAAKLVIEPIFEADFLPTSYGYRPRKTATEAAEAIRVSFPKGFKWTVEIDFADFFGSIDHDKLMELIEKRISDRRVLKLIRKWLKAGVLDQGQFSETVTGTPQGGVISPLLSNIFLHELDKRFTNTHNGQLVRFADDAVVMCKTESDAQKALNTLRAIADDLGLTLHPDKTKVIDLNEGREGFDFLGWHFHARVSGKLLEKGVRRYYLQRWPSARSMKRVRQKIKDRTGHNRNGTDIRIIIKELNRILRGWSNYFRTGNAALKFNRLDWYVVCRLRKLLVKRKGRNLKPGQVLQWTREWFETHGLFRLRGTVCYPGAA